jgi:hypothetical protein
VEAKLKSTVGLALGELLGIIFGYRLNSRINLLFRPSNNYRINSYYSGGR